MTSEVSSEKPKAVVVAEVADRLRQEKTEGGGRVLAVCGPAVIHTGAGPDLASLVRAGWIDILFAGNGFAAHDIEGQRDGDVARRLHGWRRAGRRRTRQPPSGHQRGPPLWLDRRSNRGQATSTAE